jgi:hypothetical protein
MSSKPAGRSGTSGSGTVRLDATGPGPHVGVQPQFGVVAAVWHRSPFRSGAGFDDRPYLALRGLRLDAGQRTNVRPPCGL